jgi:hypothetical protein
MAAQERVDKSLQALGRLVAAQRDTMPSDEQTLADAFLATLQPQEVSDVAA